MEETGVPRENHRPLASHWQALSHNVVHVTQIEIQTHYISMITAMIKWNIVESGIKHYQTNKQTNKHTCQIFLEVIDQSKSK